MECLLSRSRLHCWSLSGRVCACACFFFYVLECACVCTRMRASSCVHNVINIVLHGEQYPFGAGGRRRFSRHVFGARKQILVFAHVWQHFSRPEKMARKLPAPALPQRILLAMQHNIDNIVHTRRCTHTRANACTFEHVKEKTCTRAHTHPKGTNNANET